MPYMLLDSCGAHIYENRFGNLSFCLQWQTCSHEGIRNLMQSMFLFLRLGMVCLGATLFVDEIWIQIRLSPVNAKVQTNVGLVYRRMHGTNNQHQRAWNIYSSVGLVSSILSILYHLGIYNEDFTFCFGCHSGLYSMQKTSYPGTIFLVSVWCRMVMT